MHEKILILDFGSQYTQLIARRIREISVYCEIYPYNHFPAPDSSIKGVILSGSPYSVRDTDAPNPDLSDIKGKIPVLGVCYGAQLLVQNYGGEVLASGSREYGRANLVHLNESDPLFKGIKSGTQVWMSHGDTIETIPDGYEITGSTASVKTGAVK
jgi:GMP synthase (glutamine-hydrolysing)